MSYNPHGHGGLLVRDGGPAPSPDWEKFHDMITAVARRLFPTLTEPLRSREQLPEAELGRWGAETAEANVWLAGAGARRGGGVSGIPGHNAARAVLERG